MRLIAAQTSHKTGGALLSDGGFDAEWIEALATVLTV
jgi:hypothetical protein